MKTININSIEEYHQLIRKHWDANYLYRGEDQTGYPLLPQFGRDKNRNKKNDSELEKEYFDEFKRMAIPSLEYMPVDNWDWIAIAQHYGLHTRLLDWTTNPLVAAYFAVYKKQKEDAVVYLFNIDDLENVDSSTNPFSIESNYIYRPKHISNRISAQSGLFTIHSDPEKKFNPPTLKKIIIKKECQAEFWVTLGLYNVNSFSMFPDLSGLAQELTNAHIWKTKN